MIIPTISLASLTRCPICTEWYEVTLPVGKVSSARPRRSCTSCQEAQEQELKLSWYLPFKKKGETPQMTHNRMVRDVARLMDIAG